MISLTLPEPPSANRYWRTRVGGRASRAFVQTYLSAEAKQFKADVETYCVLHGIRPIEGDVKISVVWHRAHAGRGDLGNRLKVVEDALQGWAYWNDSQVAKIEMARITAPGRAFIVVEVEPIGVTAGALF